MNIDHTEMVAELAKPGAEIKKDITPKTWGLMSWAITQFLCQGELLDRVKKVAVYNKEDNNLSGIPPQPVPNLTPEQCHLLHMAIGIAGEASELLEAVFAHCNGKPLDLENVIEESGDIEFYHEGLRQGAMFSRKHALQSNILKLGQRYQGFQYSDKQAQLRADKAPGE